LNRVVDVTLAAGGDHVYARAVDIWSLISQAMFDKSVQSTRNAKLRSEAQWHVRLPLAALRLLPCRAPNGSPINRGAGLDKIAGATTFEVKVGETTKKFGGLIVKADVCIRAQHRGSDHILC
jgi:hypothetical protein